MFKFIDLFAGIGGFRMALENLGGECVLSCEIDKFARKTYAANYDVAHHPYPEDIRNVCEKNVPDHDVLCGGFPCQPFSIAGNSKNKSMGREIGELDTRGTLFWDMLRIIKEKKPKYLILENVKNLLSKSHTGTMKKILSDLAAENYVVTYDVLNGTVCVPQNRPRVFFAAIRDTELTTQELHAAVFGDIHASQKAGLITKKYNTLQELLEPVEGI